MFRRKRRLTTLMEAGKYENPVTKKEEVLSQMVATYFRDDMEDLYPDISKKELDAAEEDLYGALIDVGALQGKDLETSHSGGYDDLLIAIETKLKEGEYSSGFGAKGSGAFDEDVPGYGDLEDEYSPDYVGDNIEDLARGDRVMDNRDETLYKDNPDYQTVYDEDEDTELDESRSLNESFGRNNIKDFFKRYSH